MGIMANGMEKGQENEMDTSPPKLPGLIPACRVTDVRNCRFLGEFRARLFGLRL